LHLGCGSDPLPHWLKSFKETRYDINPNCNPDIVGDIKDLGDIGEYDVVFSQHCLEHLHQHDVPVALKEWHRVLKDKGVVVIFVPDCEDAKPTEEVLFESPAGGITGLDLFYGFRKVLKDNPYMAHKTAFTQDSLRKALIDAGYSRVEVKRLWPYNMMGTGVK
jgi:SAM-dependent methyltransferase